MNDKLNQKEQDDKQKKIELYMPWIYLLAGILLIIASLAIFNSLKPLVENSYSAHAVDTSDPDTLLNHANTYYWWGRYRKNTLPEFDTAAVWAGRALQLAQSRFAQDKDTTAFLQRKLQAEQLIAQARQQADICKYNIASYIPTYMEIMGYDDDYMHEDADPEDVPNIALRGALDRLVNVFSPDKNVPVASRTSFAMVNVKTSNPMAEEMLVQELNNKTRMYTIAPHELARIAGNDSITVSRVVGDSLLMKKIAAAFSTDELAVIDFTENDKVNGIYYYGIRLKIWHAEKGWDSRNVYTEYMIRDRVFNQVTVFIGRLILVVLLLALGMNFIMMPFASWFSNFRPVTPYYFLLCCIIAMLAQYLLVTFGLKNFLNPSPDAYFVSDPGEQWTFAYPLTFILPGLITYLVLGKMDNFISSFRSDFENPLALFALVAGSLLPMAFSFTYYQTIRFGFSASTNAIFTIVLMVLFIALAVSRYWSAIINFPQKIHWAVRLTTWMGFGVHILIAFLFAGSLLKYYDTTTIDSWFLNVFLIAAAVMELIKSLTDFFVKKCSESPSEEISEENQPEDIQTITIDGDMVIQRLTGKQGNHNNPVEKTYASLYVRSERGTSARNAVVSTLLSKLTEEVDSLVIDFATDKGNSDVHYLPFAKAFEERLSYTKFNDVAETARKTSNFIGKALSAITSAAGILIDDGQTKPRKTEDVVKSLLEKLSGKNPILLLDHIEKIDEENIQLLEALVKAIITRRQENGKSDKSPQVLPLLIAFGTGEFGYRDKVLSILGSLRQDGMEKGVLEFELRFNNAVENYLAKQQLPVQVELHLKNLFIRENHDYSPDLVKDTYERLEKNQVIKKVNFEGEEMQLLTLSDLTKLPNTSKRQSLDEAVQQHTAMKDVLIAAAYLADSKAKFHLPVLAYALKMDRIPLLHLLKEAERYNLVYDLKGNEHFYWYAFTDRAIVEDFKEVENPRQEAVSQLAYEYYRGYVEYFCPEISIEANMLHINQLIDAGKLSVDSLILLAQRSAEVERAFPPLAFAIHHLTATHIGANGIARFDEALAIVNTAFNMYEGFHETEKLICGRYLFELKKLKFRLLIETGKFKNEDYKVDELYNQIQKDEFYQLQHDDERNELVSQKVKLCFRRYDDRKDDGKNGKDLVGQLLSSQSINPLMALRLDFYSIKLIHSKKYTDKSENTNWDKCAFEVNEMYKGLLGKIERNLEGQQNSEFKDLYREVLNDYAGFFLTDKMLPLSGFEQNKKMDQTVTDLFFNLGASTVEDLFLIIKDYLTKRIMLEINQIQDRSKIFNESHAFNEEILRELLSNNEKQIDKRGLCYTLNYYTRACKIMKKYDEALRFSSLAFDFNKVVGDYEGACLSSGTSGLLAKQTNKDNEAFEFFRTSFGIGWSINHFSRFTMAMHMLLMSSCLGDKKRRKEAEFYLWQMTQYSVLPYFGKENMGDSLALYLMISKTKLEELCGTRAIPQPFQLLGNKPEFFIGKLNDLLHNRNQDLDCYRVDRMPGKWMMSPELESIKLSINSDDSEQVLVLEAASIRDSGQWFIEKIAFQKK